MTAGLLNLAGLTIEIFGVAILMFVDSAERKVGDAQERRHSAHQVTLQNPDHNIARRYLDGREGKEDERLARSYSFRLGSKRTRLALVLLGAGMLLQLVATAIQLCASNA